ARGLTYSRLNPTVFTYAFFFNRYVDHPDLHSFPTRRSSDLGETFDVDNNVWVVGSEDECYVIDPAHDVDAVLEAVGGRKVLGVRSEEHTSELQSRFDLVCRLLLEKKKKQ